jgi:hypothetical protein
VRCVWFTLLLSSALILYPFALPFPAFLALTPFLSFHSPRYSALCTARVAPP